MRFCPTLKSVMSLISIELREFLLVRVSRLKTRVSRLETLKFGTFFDPSSVPLSFSAPGRNAVIFSAIALPRSQNRAADWAKVAGRAISPDGDLYGFTAREMAARGRHASPLDLWLAPPWTLAQTYFLKLGFLDGYAGFCIARAAAHYVRRKYEKLRSIHP
jgi:hypothetical protein